MDTWEDLRGFINLSGVRSTGLTLSASMGVYVADLMRELGYQMVPKEHFKKTRKGIVRFNELSDEEKEALIAKDSAYGRVVCRCETVTEGEILDAIHRPLGARSMDAVKRRVRAGMGRCQGGFCGPKVLKILARELGIPETEVLKNNAGSYMVAGMTRGGGSHE